MTDELLSECLIAFVGEPGRPAARSDKERVLDRAGEHGRALIPVVRVILDEVRTADPPLYDFADLPSMAQAVRTFLHKRHPELSTAAVQAVANRFTYDWK